MSVLRALGKLPVEPILNVLGLALIVAAWIVYCCF